MADKIRVEVEGKTTIAISKLTPFQGELKTLAREKYEGLRANLLKNGISFVVHVWKHKGKNYIIDGHQRVWTLNHMKKHEGITIPAIPVSFVHAKSFKAAKEKVLAGISEYGAYTEDSLAKYLKENDIPYDQVVANYSFPNIDMNKFVGLFGEAAEQMPEPDDDNKGSDTRSASEGVKQVQLFFDSKTHAEFTSKVGALTAFYKLESITDVVMEAVRAAYKSNIKKRDRLVDAVP